MRVITVILRRVALPEQTLVLTLYRVRTMDMDPQHLVAPLERNRSLCLVVTVITAFLHRVVLPVHTLALSLDWVCMDLPDPAARQGHNRSLVICRNTEVIIKDWVGITISSITVKAATEKDTECA